MVTPVSPGIPRAMVLRLTSRSPRRSGLFVTVVRASSRRLDAGVEASEPHDFTVREKRHSSKAPPRPPHPAAYVRDDRETPLGLGRDDSLYSCFYQTAKRNIFSEGARQKNGGTARRANQIDPVQ